MPSSPGVYWFHVAGKVIYVGKAKNLKRRVSSYAKVKPNQPKTYKLVTTATNLSFKELPTEIDAILTEAELIKSYQPQYNILLKDDKSPLYILVTKEKFPRVLTARKKELYTLYSHLSESNVFGPFNSGLTVKRILRLTRQIFKFCNLKTKNNQPCFYYHINLCSGVCAGKITEDQYRKLIKRLKLFLAGKRINLIKQLKKDMLTASKLEQFELAGTLRDQLLALNELHSLHGQPLLDELPMLEEDLDLHRVLQVKRVLHHFGVMPADYPLHRLECYDISNTQGTNATASMVVFIDGKPAPSEYKRFKIKYTIGPNDPKMMAEVLARRLNHPEWGTPDLIVIDGGRTQLNSAYQIIEGKIPTISLVKHPDRLLIKHQDQFNFYILKPGTPTANLFQHLRDESHRFAKKYHTFLARKALTTVHTF